MIKGKSLFLDIGTDSIKAVEITKTADRIILSESITINEAKRFLSVYGIENMDGLINCIVENLEKYEITAKNVYIVSSALRIESTLEIIADNEKSTAKDEKNNTTISSRQVYGSLTYDDRVTTASIVSTGDIYTLRSLAEAFDARGYRVISIEDSITAVMNLVKLTRYTYDYPGKVIISFGGTTRYICYSKDCPVSVNEYDAKISDMISYVADKTKMSYQEVNTLFFKYGLVMSTQAVHDIIQRGLDPNEYFYVVRTCCLSYIQQFKEVVDAECEARMMGRCYIIVTGGYADVPGLYDMLEHEFCDEFKILLRNAIPRAYENDYLLIQNRTGRTDLGAVYGTCTGLILKDMFKNSINLLPKYTRRDSAAALPSAFRIGTLICSGLFVISLCLVLFTAGRFMITPGTKENGNNLTSRYAELQKEVEDLDQQIATIEKLDKTGKELVSICTDSTSGLLTITSVDTAGVLTAKNEEEAEPSEESAAKEKTESEEAGSENSEKEEEEESEYNDGDYIIRGFAADPELITSFYNRILSGGFMGKAAMKDGIKTVALSSGEQMYIFEIVVKK